MRLKNKHIIPLFIIFLLTVIPLHNYFSTTEIASHSHYTDSTFFTFKSIEKHIFEWNSLYLWSPYEYSGVPLLGHPETFFISLPLLLILLLKHNTVLAINLTLVISFFLSGLGMYFLFYNTKKNHRAALIAAVVFMFNLAIFHFGLRGNISVMVPLSLMPFALLFTHKAITSKKMMSYSFLASIILALQLHAGGMIIFLYSFILLSGYAMFNTLGKRFVQKFIKAVLVISIIACFSMGLGAVKLLPTFEFQETSSRVAQFSYQEFLGGNGHYISSINQIIPNLVIGKTTLSVPPQLGIVAFLLVLLSLLSWKNKRVLFYFLASILVIAAVGDTFLTLFLYKFVPFFGNLKNIDRMMVLVALSAAMLAGFGYCALENLIQKKGKKWMKKEFVWVGVLLLLIIELVVFANVHDTVRIADKNEIELLNAIDNDTDLFRVHYYQTIPFDLSHVVGAHGKSSLVLYDFGGITGGGTIWPQKLGNYLFFAGQQQSSTLWGLLNVKYLISTGPAEIPNTELVGEFEPCDVCAQDMKAKKVTHIYKNNVFMPRAYLVKNAILVAGGNQNLMFPLLLHNEFNPNTTVFISAAISEFSLQKLQQFSTIMLSSNPSQQETSSLKNYADNGGIILPDIFNNQNSISEDGIYRMLTKIKHEQKPVDITQFSGNTIKVLPKEKGILVISDTFSTFPGWEATSQGTSLKLLNANEVTTAVMVNNPEEITFTYKPRAFRKGLIISTITGMILLLYFFWRVYIRLIKEKKS